MRTLLFCLLFFGSVALAAGTIDAYPQGEKLHHSLLSQVRQDNLQQGVKGPLATRALRYRDVWRGQKRTFLWTAQKFENPDGTIAYAVVLTQLLANGQHKLLMAAGTTDLELVDGGEEEPAYRVVYEGLNRHLRQTGLTEKF